MKNGMIVCANGSREWYLNGEPHREDGPAVERPDGTREWYLNGKRHREDGPAVEEANGTREWYWRGEKLRVRTQKGFLKIRSILMMQDMQKA